MNKLLEGKVIVISGGTKGIGKGIAIEACKQGAKVVIAGRDCIAGKNIEMQLNKEGVNCIFVKTDLFSISDIKNLFKTAFQKFGKINGFVNYAGVTNIASMTDCDEKTFDTIFMINVKAAFFCCQEAIHYMKMNSDGGSIVVFGSPHDDKGQIDRAPYAFSKAALSVMVIHLAKYYAEYKIRANYVTAGWTPTEGELALRKSQGISEEQLREEASKIIPIGRIQEVKDHVPGVIYFLSDLSSMVTGSNLRVSGGLFF